MKKIASLAVITSALLLTAGTALAQDTTQPPLLPTLRATAQKVQEERKEIRNAIKDVRENSRDQIKTLRQGTKEKMREATSSTERRDVVKNALGERKEIMENRRASTTAMKTQLRVLARQHFGPVIQRFSVAFKQYDNLSSRIQSRIDKLKAAGADTSAAEALFATAKDAVLQAKADAQAVSDLVAQVSDSSDPKAVQAQIEASVKKTTASVKTAHDALDAVANNLVKLARTQSKNTRATSTAENNQ